MTGLPDRWNQDRSSWRVLTETDTVEDLHQLREPAEAVRTVRVMRPIGPAIVLGSSQPESDIDPAAAIGLGVCIARRRSGGGAVLVIPGEHTWIDLLIPRRDPLWDDDIITGANWVGEAWLGALGSAGVTDAVIHRGRLVNTVWSPLVCFAGVGPGEVVVADRKVMGLSQRRTRDWIRIQSVVHSKWRPELLVELLALEPTRRRECLSQVRGAVMAVDVNSDLLIRSLLAALPD